MSQPAIKVEYRDLQGVIHSRVTDSQDLAKIHVEQAMQYGEKNNIPPTKLGFKITTYPPYHDRISFPILDEIYITVSLYHN